eukprot:6161645-Prymnesium_polylepis.1
MTERTPTSSGRPRARFRNSSHDRRTAAQSRAIPRAHVLSDTCDNRPAINAPSPCMPSSQRWACLPPQSSVIQSVSSLCPTPHTPLGASSLATARELSCPHCSDM